MKSLQVLHPSFAVYAGVLVTALVVIGGLVVTSRGVHGHLVRLGKCAIAGVIAATALIVTVVLFAAVTLTARRRRTPAFGRPAQRRTVRTGWPE